MQNLKSKTAAILISVLMIISIGASTTLLQNAHGAINIQTFAYINVAPDPCGVGQSVTIDFWLAVPTQTSQFAVNMTILVTHPDGTTETLGPFISDYTGGTTTHYVPEATGNYTFKFIFGGMTLNGGPTSPYTGDYDEPSQSAPVTLTVQSTPAAQVPFTPLPTQYWQTPVSAENVQNWYAVTGPWLGLGVEAFGATGEYNITSNYNPYTTGPTTAHILWTKPWAFGGVAGGDVGGTENSNYWSTSQYEPKWNPVVINGFEYATWYPGSTSNPAGIQCISLYNGQTQWVMNTTNALRCGQVLDFTSPNQYGCTPYIWTTGSLPGVVNSGTEWNMYDAMTGDYILSIVNGTALQLTVDSSGDLIGYYTNATAGTEIVHPNISASVVQTNTGPTLNCWNSTNCVGYNPALAELMPPQGGVIRFELGLMWATPIPTSLNGVPISPTLGGGGYLSATGAAFTMNDGAIMLTSGLGTPASGETAGYVIEAGFDANTGALLWIDNRTETPWTRLAGFAAGDGVYIDLNQATFVMNAYSLFTGQLAWSTTLTTANGGTPNTYDEFDFNNVVDSTTGVDYWWALGGDVWAVNMTNGNIIWWTDTNALIGSSGTETPYGIWPLWVFTVGVVAGGMLYLPVGHEYSPPLFHGAEQLAINITNGNLVWSILAFDVENTEVSYGIMTATNAYDNQVYAYGIGPSKTTVTAPDLGVTTVTPVVISGTVTDVSAGASQQLVASNFPNGLPCVSDASMTQFMEYVYEQQSHPSNTTGVPVTLTAKDPNGNQVTLGTTTSDQSGYYSLTWTPPIAGNYTISATFAGTGSYYGSYAETSIFASNPAPTQAPAATPTSQATTQSYIIGIGIAIIVVIIVIGAVLAMLLLRKRP